MEFGCHIALHRTALNTDNKSGGGGGGGVFSTAKYVICCKKKNTYNYQACSMLHIPIKMQMKKMQICHYLFAEKTKRRQSAKQELTYPSCDAERIPKPGINAKPRTVSERKKDGIYYCWKAGKDV